LQRKQGFGKWRYSSIPVLRELQRLVKLKIASGTAYSGKRADLACTKSMLGVRAGIDKNVITRLLAGRMIDLGSAVKLSRLLGGPPGLHDPDQ